MHYILLLAPLIIALADNPKNPVATAQPEPSVNVEGAAVITVKPVPGEGLPDQSAISAERAYQVLREKARSARAGVKLYSLSTGMHGLSRTGLSSGWSAEFLSDAPGEMVNLVYRYGEIEGPFFSYAPDRPGVPEPDAIGYDTKKLYEETMQQSDAGAEWMTRVTASLYRSSGSGEALWLLNIYKDDDRIGQTVVFKAKTMKFSHKTDRRTD